MCGAGRKVGLYLYKRLHWMISFALVITLCCSLTYVDQFEHYGEDLSRHYSPSFLVAEAASYQITQ
jgi:hypothetical protein